MGGSLFKARASASRRSFLEVPLCQSCARDPSDNCSVSARDCVTANCVLLHCE